MSAQENKGRTQIRTSTILKKAEQERITVLTAADYPTAKLLDEAGVDVILVGDSLGQTVLGYESSLRVTLQDMIHHASAVVRGTQTAMVVVDMPFGSYQESPTQAVKNACKLMHKTGAHGVKLEGGQNYADHIKAIVQAGVPVMAHVGLLPQSVHQMGGYRMTGKSDSEADQIFNDAKAVEEAGAFSVVLECVQHDLTAKISEHLKIPTIGIGSGKACSGQVLVTHDLLGMTQGHVPKFVTQEAQLSESIMEAVKRFIHKTEAQ